MQRMIGFHRVRGFGPGARRIMALLMLTGFTAGGVVPMELTMHRMADRAPASDSEHTHAMMSHSVGHATTVEGGARHGAHSGHGAHAAPVGETAVHAPLDTDCCCTFACRECCCTGTFAEIGIYLSDGRFADSRNTAPENPQERVVTRVPFLIPFPIPPPKLL